jgi:hypothetical protein
MAKGSKKGKSAKKERRERRFLPRSTTNPLVVRLAGGLGAATLGAGAWAQLGRFVVAKSSETPAEPIAIAPWLLAGGAVLLGAAIWFGTSGDPAIHVGDAGIGAEKGTMRRMAWHQVESVTFEAAGGAGVLVAKGKDESGAELVVRAPIDSQPQAAAWLLKEARARVPAVVDVSEEALGNMPETARDAGEVLQLDPIQVVGKHCAASGTIIAYEPDARVCPRCERVYHKAHVPETCACGASLTSLQTKAAG